MDEDCYLLWNAMKLYGPKVVHGTTSVEWVFILRDNNPYFVAVSVLQSQFEKILKLRFEI